MIKRWFGSLTLKAISLRREDRQDPDFRAAVASLARDVRGWSR